MPPARPKMDAGVAFSWAWSTFTAHWRALVVPGVLMVLATIVPLIAYFVLLFPAIDAFTEAAADPYATSDVGIGVDVGSLVVVGVLYLVAIIASFYVQASMTSGALRVADGEQPTVSMFLVPRNLGRVVVTALLVGIIVTVGSVLCIVPGLIAAFFLQFAIIACIDRNSSATEAIRTSFDVAKTRTGDSLLTFLCLYVINMLGAAVCFLGVVISAPLGQLFFAHCYRQLIGGTIVPVAASQTSPAPPTPPAGPYDPYR